MLSHDGSKLKQTLHSIFGFNSFRNGQKEIVEAILNKQDVFAVMPTGGGKSLCYQLPACMLPGTCIIFSPLISLMKDQVDSATETGINSAFFNSSQSYYEQSGVLKSLSDGTLKLLYIAPERLSVARFMEILKKTTISFFAIDEAHCISEWGHDFRPEYLNLSMLIDEFPEIPITAFTATATEKVQNDIVTRLRLRTPYMLRASFNRPNLYYEVIPKTNTNRQIFDIVKKHPDQAGIVYRTTRKDVESTTTFLCDHTIDAIAYHAGLDDTVRQENQEKFNQDSATVIVATIAFGMGIDKSNVRYIIHGDLPKNMENYYQESGRSGRDGEPAQCTLIYGRGDIPRIRYFLDQIQDEQQRTRQYQNLQKMINYAEVTVCRRKQILEYFGEHVALPRCGNCDICNDLVEKVDVSTQAQMFLSALIRTGSRFGAGHIIDVVCGADTQKVHSFQHDTLSCYGVGKNHSKLFWRHLVDNLLAYDCIRQSDGTYPILLPSTNAKAVLKGVSPVYMLQHKEEKQRGKKDSKKAHQPANIDLFNHLRSLRLELARKRKVPPYVIFSDKTLHDMCRLLPDSLDDMLSVTGVGEKKLELYGQQFLAAISHYKTVNHSFSQ
ncbi:MAG: DNA helicase RecQ [Chitinivibrionales bacterium]|nr:DNA helicase RecQ [Chitinivibrionales bacterium]